VKSVIIARGMRQAYGDPAPIGDDLRRAAVDTGDPVAVLDAWGVCAGCDEDLDVSGAPRM
jgi:hypothetical protein